MLWNRRRLGRATSFIECDSQRLRRDQAWFLSIFIAKVALDSYIVDPLPIDSPLRAWKRFIAMMRSM